MKLLFACVVLVTLLLAGCGQKGPLFLPGERAQQSDSSQRAGAAPTGTQAEAQSTPSHGGQQ